jgi:hypothetical protein
MMVMPILNGLACGRDGVEAEQTWRAEANRRSEVMVRKRNQLRVGEAEIMRDGKTELFELVRIRTRGAIRSGACTSPWNDRTN